MSALPQGAEPTPVVIVGMGGVLPGAASLDGFWANVLAGVDAAREAPPDRWLFPPEEAFQAGDPAPDRVYGTRGCFVDGFTPDLEGFDLPPATLERLDPLCHLALHAARSAVRNARMDATDPSRVGVIIGNIALPTETSSALTREALGPLLAAAVGAPWPDSAGSSTDPRNHHVAELPAGVIARAMGLGGGVCTLDAACASSLYALALAVGELTSGRADAMIAGGVSRPDCLYTQMGFSQLRALSPSGRCAPFDAAGDGLVVGEGAGFFVLKRVPDALRDGDRIYARIAGWGLSNDKGKNLLAPDTEGQLSALREAYRTSGWRPSDVDLIECHATGTPVGDAVEITSLQRLWADEPRGSRRCVIGSVKSNVGHLLTGAGAAGVIKVLKAFEHGVLPPTANFRREADGMSLADGPFEVLTAPRAWDRRTPDTPYRAAVSAFGLGGINAHVLLEAWSPEESSRATAVPIEIAGGASPAEPIAVVGMDARLGGYADFAQLSRGLIEGRPGDLSDPRWWGHPIDEATGPARGRFLGGFEFPLARFRIPPRELEESLPQQLLMLLTAAGAVDDAGLSRPLGSRTGVFVGLGLDPNTNNFHLRWWLPQLVHEWNRVLGLGLDSDDVARWIAALREAVVPPLSANRTMGALAPITASRIARHFEAGGPSFTLASGATSGLRALTTAARALQTGRLDCAIVGAVDLGGDLRTVLAHRALVAEAGTDGSPVSPGEGAVSLVLKRKADALADGDRIYASLTGLGMRSGGGVDRSASVRACAAAARAALDESGLGPEAVGYLEAWDSERADEAAVERKALADVYGVDAGSDRPGPCVGGPATALTGSLGNVGGLAGVLRACLVLHHRTLPRNPAESSSDAASAVHGFRASNRARPWIIDRAAGPRIAAVSAMSLDGNCAHAVLEEGDAARAPLATLPEVPFVVEGRDLDALRQGLGALSEAGQAATDPETLARAWLAEQPLDPARKLALSITAGDMETLRRRIRAARARLDATHDASAVGDSAAAVTSHAAGTAAAEPGVYFTTEPLYRPGALAFVYPGSGQSYPDLGAGLAQQWPQVLARQQAENANLAQQFGLDLAARGDTGLARVLLAQVAHGALATDLLAAFGVHPDAAIGYSLGDSAALFGLRVWTDREAMCARLRESDLFARALSGPCTAARTAWGLSEGDAVDWCSGVVDRGADDVQAALDVLDSDRVYLQIINTPRECMVGGHREDVERLVAGLGCRFLPVADVSATHCAVARPVADAYRALHVLPTSPPEGVRFYGGSRGKPYAVTPETAADAILAQAIETLDFPARVEHAYADGVRIFLDLGPGGTTARMVSETLGDRPHLACAVASRADDEVRGVVRMAAALVAERVPVDLAAVIGPSRDARPEIEGPSLSVRLGADRIAAPAAPAPRQATVTAPVTARAPAAEPVPVAAALEPSAAGSVGRSTTVPASDAGDGGAGLLRMLAEADRARLEAHAAYLAFSQQLTRNLVRTLEAGGSGSTATGTSPESSEPSVFPIPGSSSPTTIPPGRPESARCRFDRDQCMRFAVGAASEVLGPDFAPVDAYPTRVRLPDEPLMLVDRIVSIEGEQRSLDRGRIVTEHDVLSAAWYLDGGRIPAGIAIESGQADLFLSAYLGIDFETRGLAMYRLLDAAVTFHRQLPAPGETVRYDIHIDHFFRQGDTHLFRFRFEGSVNGEPVLTMQDGCAGFFTDAELSSGRGIVPADQKRRTPAKGRAADWAPFLPVARESYDTAALDALRAGDLGRAFGEAFAGIPVARPLTLPGGRLRTLDRVVELDPEGGRYGCGLVRAEQDIDPEAWFLTCHFVDDQVMPGTLMYECSLQALRVFLLRMGWVAEDDGAAFQPVPGVTARLKCRGQVLKNTRTAAYEVHVKEIGYGPEPYALADTIMYADDRAIVHITDMNVRLTGATRETLEAVWRGRGATDDSATGPIFDHERILAFTRGRPSEAFGDRYLPFDQGRFIARLPAEPFNFVHRVARLENVRPWRMEAGGSAVTEYDVPADGWYFASDRQPRMPYAVLLEAALQSCGWLAAYMGSALTSDTDLRFRNLGGEATAHAPVLRDAGTLTTTVTVTRASSSAGMIIQHYDFAVCDRDRLVFDGNTYFGFFSEEALASQVGIRDAEPWVPPPELAGAAVVREIPDTAPYPDARWRMVDRITLHLPAGGPEGLGFWRASALVDAQAWFFRAHFLGDPVWPGSLGLESLLQVLRVAARERWNLGPDTVFESPVLGETHQWVYRGQIVPSDREVTVEATITAVDDETRLIRADGYLIIDGRIIYQMKDFGLRAALDR